MKILVVDDDPVARKVLNAFLTQSNYDVDVVEDAEQALEAMQEEDAPPIAIIDWFMPGMDGLELCATLRELDLPIQPYLFILNSKKDKNDIAQALDAGADDYLTKPFNMVETCARLRVAERSIGRQQALLAEIERLRTGPREPAAPATAPAHANAHANAHADPVPPPPPTAREELLPSPPFELESLYLDAIVTETLSKAGLLNTAARTPFPAAMPEYAAWYGLLLTKENLWLDLLLEADEASLIKLFALAKRRPDLGREELANFCASILLPIGHGINSIQSARGSEIFVPFPVGATEDYVGRLSHQITGPATRLHYEIDQATITLVLLPHASPRQSLRPDQLRLMDVLADQYPPAAAPHEALFPKGLALDEQLLGQIMKFTQGASNPPLLLCHRPSPLAVYFNQYRVADE
jgi:sigma-B regulation protein RsbU (phosphoserine phosphatase)